MANIALRYVNGYLIEDGDGWTLVDCGLDAPETLAALEDALHALGARLQDVHTLIVTHFHTDHYGLAGTLARLVRPRFLMPRLDWLYVRDHLSDARATAEEMLAWLERNGLSMQGWGEDERIAVVGSRAFTLVAPDVELDDGSRVTIGERTFQVISTPGHTPGHVCLYDADRRVLVAGDHVLGTITTPLGSRPFDGDPLGSYLESLRRVAALDVELVLPGHGKPFTGLAHRIMELLAHFGEREAAVLETLSSGRATAAEVAAALTWTPRRQRFDHLSVLRQRTVLGQTLAHLEKLRAEGRVSRADRDGLTRYELAGGPKRDGQVKPTPAGSGRPSP